MEPALQILEQDSVTVAPLILGWTLHVTTPAGVVAGRIVETEAYHQDDAASHSFRGLTPRTAPMFERAGTIYVYFTYGMHHCMNIVCGPKGRGEGVLLRALEPTEGLEIMQQNRGGIADVRKLCSGPGRLAQALGVTIKHAGLHIDEGPIKLIPAKAKADLEVVQTTRVGIKHAADEPWRFYIAGNPYVSRK